MLQDASSQVILSGFRSKARSLKSFLVISSNMSWKKTFFFCFPQSTPIQGSKLRLPGYLSGKGFQSGEEGTLINTAILKARSQAAGELNNQPSSFYKLIRSKSFFLINWESHSSCTKHVLIIPG